jgi:hypothetical protein
LEHRVNHCPCYGPKQYYEDKCSYYGYDYIDGDTGGGQLDLKYCGGVDCGKEIGGLIRYSKETGEPLSLNRILDKTDFEIVNYDINYENDKILAGIK